MNCERLTDEETAVAVRLAAGQAAEVEVKALDREGAAEQAQDVALNFPFSLFADAESFKPD